MQAVVACQARRQVAKRSIALVLEAGQVTLAKKSTITACCRVRLVKTEPAVRRKVRARFIPAAVRLVSKVQLVKRFYQNVFRILVETEENVARLIRLQAMNVSVLLHIQGDCLKQIKWSK